MLIRIDKSELFKTDPSRRFAKEFNVPEGLWTEMWIRYKIKGYNVQELQEYMHIKVGWKPTYQLIRRWIMRSEIYSISKDAVKKGATTVVSAFFKEYESQVVKELFKNMKYSGKKNTRNMV